MMTCLKNFVNCNSIGSPSSFYGGWDGGREEDKKDNALTAVRKGIMQ